MQNTTHDLYLLSLIKNFNKGKFGNELFSFFLNKMSFKNFKKEPKIDGTNQKHDFEINGFTIEHKTATYIESFKGCKVHVNKIKEPQFYSLLLFYPGKMYWLFQTKEEFVSLFNNQKQKDTLQDNIKFIINEHKRSTVLLPLDIVEKIKHSKIETLFDIINLLNLKFRSDCKKISKEIITRKISNKKIKQKIYISLENKTHEICSLLNSFIKQYKSQLIQKNKDLLLNEINLNQTINNDSLDKKISDQRINILNKKIIQLENNFFCDSYVFQGQQIQKYICLLLQKEYLNRTIMDYGKKNLSYDCSVGNHLIQIKSSKPSAKSNCFTFDGIFINELYNATIFYGKFGNLINLLCFKYSENKFKELPKGQDGKVFSPAIKFFFKTICQPVNQTLSSLIILLDRHEHKTKQEIFKINDIDFATVVLIQFKDEKEFIKYNSKENKLFFLRNYFNYVIFYFLKRNILNKSFNKHFVNIYPKAFVRIHNLFNNKKKEKLPNIYFKLLDPIQQLYKNPKTTKILKNICQYRYEDLFFIVFYFQLNQINNKNLNQLKQQRIEENERQ
ncbi:MAG: hypothetical protein Q2306_02375 [Phytoplasma sp.]|uniref:hypothetical protein n=1 Tax=Phytoplasma sp. TaxID=2155 RepID=UPI002B410EF7|nr:hypothetical protein [Phytoplasma sp.]WRH06715.1 MAG: hypothetical protein Q2306_02375 [Phytoplasma sp.]